MSNLLIKHKTWIIVRNQNQKITNSIPKITKSKQQDFHQNPNSKAYRKSELKSAWAWAWETTSICWEEMASDSVEHDSGWAWPREHRLRRLRSEGAVSVSRERCLRSLRSDGSSGGLRRAWHWGLERRTGGGVRRRKEGIRKRSKEKKEVNCDVNLA